MVQVIFMVGNKSDLDAQRDVSYEEAKQFADENGSSCCDLFARHVILV